MEDILEKRVVPIEYGDCDWSGIEYFEGTQALPDDISKIICEKLDKDIECFYNREYQYSDLLDSIEATLYHYGYKLILHGATLDVRR